MDAESHGDMFLGCVDTGSCLKQSSLQLIMNVHLICEDTFLLWAGLVLQQPPLHSVGADLPGPWAPSAFLHFPRDEPGGEQLSLG